MVFSDALAADDKKFQLNTFLSFQALSESLEKFGWQNNIRRYLFLKQCNSMNGFSNNIARKHRVAEKPL